MTRLLIRRNGEEWKKPDVTVYDNEAALQELLAGSPDLLPGIKEGTAVAATEFPAPGTGSADLVCVDIDGEITIVECKLKANPEMRRHVIGQVFTYAAAIASMDYSMSAQSSQRGAVDLLQSSLSGRRGLVTLTKRCSARPSATIWPGAGSALSSLSTRSPRN